MELLVQKSYALCSLYDTLCKNHNPSDSTRKLMQALEGHIEELARDITLQEDTNKPTIQDDGISF